MTAARGLRAGAAWAEGGRVALLLAVSVGFESLFVTHGLNEVDEGWPLYAAMQLHAGGALYRDVFFVFPPGHLLPAWLAYALDPPGVVLARVFYAGFDVALVLALYALGRRLVSPGFACLGALLVALASPLSHQQQLLFGYRYLAFGALALLAFSQRLRSGDSRWMAASGALLGLAVVFRLTPAFAVACGVAAGVLLAPGTARSRARDLAALGLGGLLVAGPVFGWLAAEAGPATLWREVVVRPVAMTALQSKSVPPLRWFEDWDRPRLTLAFVAGLFRLVPLLYAGYAVALAARWVAARRGGRPFGEALLAALVVSGAVYFSRALGRADEAHLASALPPFCVVLAHLASRAFRPPVWRAGRAEALRAPVAFGAGAALLAVWVVGGGADRYLPEAFRGTLALEALDGRVRVRPGHAWVDPRVRGLEEALAADATLLVLGPQSLLYVLAGRPGPGGADVLMPGTFLDQAEERAFVERLRRDPPALVLRPRIPFDLRRSRAVEATAPQVVAFVEEHYRPTLDADRFAVWLPRRTAR